MESMVNIKGKTILVTGGTGFIGSHLAEKLITDGAKVVIPYRSINPRSYFYTQNLNRKSILVSGDINDHERVFDIVCRYEIEYIFHLAAQAIVTTALSNPGETIQTNIWGTTNVLEAARKYPGVKGVILASSDKAYGKSIHPYKETDPMAGTHPYEVSKSAADLIARAYIKTYQTPVVITRFGNVYGEGDLNFSRIIPAVILAIIRNDQLIIRSDGSYRRDYLYVKDVVSGYITLLNHFEKVKGEAFNFGSAENYSVVELLDLIRKTVKRNFSYQIKNSAVNEIHSQKLDSTKIEQRIGWKPKYRMVKVIPSIYRWYNKTLRLI